MESRYEKLGRNSHDFEAYTESRSSSLIREQDIAMLQNQALEARARPTRRPWILHGLLLVANLALFGFILSQRSRFTDARVAAAPYSPAAEAVQYENSAFNFSIFSDTRYSGAEMTQSQDQAWTDLMGHMGLWVTEDELHQLNRTSIAVPGQGYLAELAMFHQLHCLDYLRKNLYPEFYTIHETPKTIRKHISHCVDALRQAIQCHGDTSMVTYSWREDYERAWPDFQIDKQCRNYNSISAWARSRKVTLPHEKNPLFLPEYKGTSPPSRDDAHEVMTGTRLNPKLQHDLESSMAQIY